MFEADELLAGGCFNANSSGVFEVTPAMHDVHAAFAGDGRDAIGKFVDNGVFPGAELLKFDFRLPERDSASGGMFGFVQDLSRVKKCFGRNAAANEADATEPFLFLNE